MSTFELNRFNYDLRHAEAQRAFRDDPDGYLGRYDLSSEERDLIHRRDWMGLVDAGVSVYILANLGRAVGLPFAELGAAMRGETPDEMSAFIEAQNELVAPYRIVPEVSLHG